MYGIYIHIPFCVKKCNYCDFASYPDKLTRQDEYINALTKEFEMRKGLCIDTVYIGGGTPSVLTEDNINYLLKAINKNFVLNNDTEFTVEVNPKTIDERKATILKNGGVNRISMGAQSFLDSELSAIGRVHSSQDIEDSYNLLRKKGFDNILYFFFYPKKKLPETEAEIKDYLDTVDRFAEISGDIIAFNPHYNTKIPTEEMPYWELAPKDVVMP